MNPYLKMDLLEIGVDVNRATKDYFIGNEDMFERIIMSMISEDDLMQEAYDGINEGDAKKAFQATHKLKSELGYFCFDQVNTNVKAACEIFRAGNIAGSKELLDEVKDDYYKLIKILKKYSK